MDFCRMVDDLLRLHISHVQQKALCRLNPDIFDGKSPHYLAGALSLLPACHKTACATAFWVAGSLATLLPFSAPGKFARA
jgi:hypothetical protein